MDLVSPVLDIVARLWDFGVKHVAHVKHLGKRLEELRTAMDDLSDHRDDVRIRVEMGVRSQREMVTKRVEKWLSKVETIEQQVIALIHEGNLQVERKCLGCCPRNLQKAYKIGKKVLNKTAEVKELLQNGYFATLTRRLSPLSSPSTAPGSPQMMAQFPMENTVGLDSKVEDVWEKIEDGNVGIIGLYGIGGVGKTTLLKKINNEFSIRDPVFDSVIWVTQSEATKVEEFQDIVRRKLEISDDTWQKCSNENDRACEISRLLSRTRFVLLLDDVRKGFFKSQLTSLGIPLPNKGNGCKIIFTTRSEELCGYLGAQGRIKVECLPPEQALSLFSMTVGEDILNSNPEIPKLAEIFTARCSGLPLALLTVGSVMASRKSYHDWICAVEMLQSYPSEFSGMGDLVFPPIKFSYDSLTSPIARKCFLYCSIFPENCTISVDELIDIWIGEGLLDGTNPRRQGEFIIRTLKLSCLLEGDESMESVWMHEMIRDMALWLARDEEKNKNKVLVARSGTLTDQEFSKWADSSWVSVWGSSDKEIIHYPPTCPNLSTLLIRDTLVNAFPGGFFEFMTGLKALDLSGNQELVELPPEIGRLRILQYLNLSLTSITKLPTGLSNLRNLRCLLLDYTTHLKEIPPKEVMSCLSLLQVYSKMNGVMEYFDEVKVSVDDELAFLEVLEGFSCMNKICITIFCHPSVEKIFSSYSKRSCIRKLKLIDCTGLTSLRVVPTFFLLHCSCLCLLTPYISAFSRGENMSRPGDWNCRSCQHLNFQRRDSCQRCGEPRPGGGDRGGDYGSFGGRGGSSFGFTGPDVRPGDWYCTVGNCGAHNFASRSSCFKCGAAKDESSGGFESDIPRMRGYGFSTGSSSRSNWKSGDWICTRSGCNEHNFASRMECFRCNAPRDSTHKSSY